MLNLDNQNSVREHVENFRVLKMCMGQERRQGFLVLKIVSSSEGKKGGEEGKRREKREKKKRRKGGKQERKR